ncbi:MAG: carboxypeptidase regulatory-like domain-containing protein [Acidobacteria bacterium]|nr:carboxypeptidase regulatory-like domain-containing protein [Acidobacteriota bacterium]
MILAMLALSFDTSAQDLVGGAGRTDLSGGAGSSGGTRNSTPRRPKVRNTAASTGVRTVTRTKTVVLTPTTGTLSVAAVSGASLLVEPLRGGEAQEGEIEQNEGQFIFNKLAPGRYRVAAEMDGYTPDEKEVVVVANKTVPVSLNLTPITYDVTIAANVPAGEVRYALVTGIRDASGEMKYNVTGETRVTPLQNGRAMLQNLRPGTYGVDVRSADVGYQTLLATFTLPGQTTYSVTLPKLTSTKTFSAAWVSLDAWDAPAGWRVGSRKLSASGRGVALPRDESARHYKDFRIFSNVKMLNGVAASYVVRAVDSQNYYLIQVTGAQADEPYVLRGFIVRNGTAQRFGTIPADGFTSTLKANQFFSIMIEATGNEFKVSVTDSQTGDVLPLGTLVDPNRNFPIGAAGIAVRDNEQNEIERFVVCTSESADCQRG